MFKNLGPMGLVGLLIIVAGLGVIAYADLLIAAGLALVLAGIGIVVRALITGMLQMWGMA